MAEKKPDLKNLTQSRQGTLFKYLTVNTTVLSNEF